MWVDAVQQRIAITRSMLESIQAVKGTGLAQTFVQLVQRKRAQETHQMANYRWSTVWKNMIQNLPSALAPALTFVVYAAQGKELNVAKAFSSLSIITLLTNPASKLLSAIPSIAAATGSFDRIQAFLLLATRHQEKCETLFGTMETESNAPLQITELQNMTSKCPPDTTDLQTPVIFMERLTIRPSPSAKIVLRDVNLEIPLGALVMIQGPVGSGKSTLLRAILGQGVCETGSTIVTIRQPAFCAQTPWVPSGTIRDAICGVFSEGSMGEHAFDKQWYEAVLHACALNPDLDMLRAGDATRIGHGSGHLLSGGQMHRIALARAVYARRKLLLFDDIFSALDRKTRTTITSRLLGVDGILRKANSTVVLVTHESRTPFEIPCRLANTLIVDQLSYADQIYVLSDGLLRRKESHDRSSCEGMGTDDVEDEGSKGLPTLGIEDKAAMISEANEIDDLRRATGDSAVYTYYLRYVGWAKAMIFVSFVTMNVFSSTYSRKWTSHLCHSRYR